MTCCIPLYCAVVHTYLTIDGWMCDMIVLTICSHVHCTSVTCCDSKPTMTNHSNPNVTLQLFGLRLDKEIANKTLTPFLQLLWPPTPSFVVVVPSVAAGQSTHAGAQNNRAQELTTLFCYRCRCNRCKNCFVGSRPTYILSDFPCKGWKSL